MNYLKSLIFKINKSDFHFSCIAITKIDLESEILAEELEKYQQISNPKRKKEFQNVRLLRNLQDRKSTRLNSSHLA